MGFPPCMLPALPNRFIFFAGQCNLLCLFIHSHSESAAELEHARDPRSAHTLVEAISSFYTRLERKHAWAAAGRVVDGKLITVLSIDGGLIRPTIIAYLEPKLEVRTQEQQILEDLQFLILLLEKNSMIRFKDT
jgi:hypothetical protein